MKLLNAPQLKLWDQLTIENFPGGSLALMERASEAFCAEFQQRFTPSLAKPVVFCGKGNNGGDGYAIARILTVAGFSVKVFGIGDDSQLSPDCLANRQRLERHGIPFCQLEEHAPLPEISEGEVVIEALFGYGLNRPLEGFALKIVGHLNSFSSGKVAVDVPAGIPADGSGRPSDDSVSGAVFRADLTITFGCPKLPFLLPEYGPFVGEFVVKDIGLSQTALASIPCDLSIAAPEDIEQLWRARSRHTHKYSYGHLAVIGGSLGKAGATILAGRAAFRAGAGLVTLCTPASSVHPCQSALPEAMCLPMADKERVIDIPEFSGKVNAAVVGPGFGMDSEGRTKASLAAWLSTPRALSIMKLLDAEAIRFVGEDPALLALLANKTILTPHGGEAKALCGETSSSAEMLEKLRVFCRQWKVTVVMKGAYTAVISEDGKAVFSPAGTSGLAKAGSGDALAGVIGALLAQGYSTKDAALLGVYIHGRAGELASAALGTSSLLASDIADHVPNTIRQIEVNSSNPITLSAPP